MRKQYHMQDMTFAYPFLNALYRELPNPYAEIQGTIWIQDVFDEWRRQHHIEIPEEIISPKPSFTITLPHITFPALPMRFIGNALMVTSFVGLILFTAPIAALELRSLVYRATRPFIPTAEQDVPVGQIATLLASPTPTPLPTPPPKGQEFHISIPSIGVDSDIVANVDANNQPEYEEALKHGIAHAKGTALPGEDGGITKTIFLFSHSTNGSWNITRYNALFYSLKDMNPGDEITVWFWGEQFTYKVTEKKITEAEDVSFLQPQLDKEVLVLQTCWPPGTSEKRLLIFAEPVSK